MENNIPISRLYETISFTINMQYLCNLAEYHRQEIESEIVFNYDKFFTKYAQINANLAIYSSELTNLLQDEHPRDYLRTNVPVQQLEEFYETYDVREGDNMYLAPEDRLLIW